MIFYIPYISVRNFPINTNKTHKANGPEQFTGHYWRAVYGAK